MVEGKRQKVYRRIYCKVWGCSFCGPRRAWALGEGICRESIAHKLDRSLCVTLDPSKVGAANKFRYIWSVWAKFRVYLVRLLGVSLTYIAVLELQRNGMPHLHVLISDYLEHAWVSATWEKLGGGSIVWLQKVDDAKRQSRYLAKYLAKNCERGLPRGVRRFSTSRNIHLRQKAEAGAWTLIPGTMEAAHRRHKFHIVSEKEDSNGHVAAFHVVPSLDNNSWKLAIDAPSAWEDWGEGYTGLPTWPVADHPAWTDIRAWERLYGRDVRGDDEDGCDLRPSVEQGTVDGGLLDSGPDEAA
jgi:hypothetical protein